MTGGDELFALTLLSTIVEGPDHRAPSLAAVELKKIYGADKVIKAMMLLTEHELILDPTKPGVDKDWLVATEKGKTFNGNFKSLLRRNMSNETEKKIETYRIVRRVPGAEFELARFETVDECKTWVRGRPGFANAEFKEVRENVRGVLVHVVARPLESYAIYGEAITDELQDVTNTFENTVVRSSITWMATVLVALNPEQRVALLAGIGNRDRSSIERLLLKTIAS